MKRLNEGLQRWQTIKKFRLLPRDLDIEHGELTPSLKLKRPVVEREYKAPHRGDVRGPARLTGGAWARVAAYRTVPGAAVV